MPRYLLHFTNSLVEFRNAEIAALSLLAKRMPCSSSANRFAEQFQKDTPFCIVELESEELLDQLSQRSVLLHSVSELWATAASFKELYEKIRTEKKELCERYSMEDVSYKILVNCFGLSITQSHKVNKIEEAVRSLSFRGRVDLRNPKETFCISEYYGPENIDRRSPDEPPKTIAQGQRKLPHLYRVQQRKCIGNTSMESNLAFLMTNIAAVKPGDFVCDPFVGTGSLLLAAAHFRAYCVGTDISYKILHGIGKSSRANEEYRKRGENLAVNFQQYGLSDYFLGALLADASRYELWRTTSLFDAIITDPPYGIRERSSKLGCKSDKSSPFVPPEHLDNHIPAKTKYAMGDVFLDLLNFAADYLVTNGRLVYWLPVFYGNYTEDAIPRHPRLKLVANCEQRLASNYGRQLIAMEKTGERTDDNEQGAHFIRNCFSESSLRDLILPSDRPRKRRENPRKEILDDCTRT